MGNGAPLCDHDCEGRPDLRVIRVLALAVLALLGTSLLLVLLAGWALVELRNGWQRERVRAALEHFANRALAEGGVALELRIGALARHADLLASQAAGEHFANLQDALRLRRRA